MMRPVTCLSLIVALGMGLYLYQVKHRAQLLDQDINRTVKAAAAARDRIGLLKAEWALLEDPQRLQDLATHHLQLQPLAPTQFVRLEDLAAHLPQVPANPAPPEPPVAAATPVAKAPPVTLAQAAAPSTALAPMLAAPALQMAAAAAPALAAPATFAQLPPAPVRSAAPRAVRPGIVVSLVKPHPLYAPVMPAYEPSPVVVHAPTVQTASATATLSPPVPYVGSALGMARTGLTPPVPVAPSSAGLASGSSLGYAGAR